MTDLTNEYSVTRAFPLNTSSDRISYPWMSKKDAEAWRDNQRVAFLTNRHDDIDHATCYWWACSLDGRQTATERAVRKTTDKNKRGWMSRDERRGPELIEKIDALSGTLEERFAKLDPTDQKRYIDVITNYPKQMASAIRAAQEASMNAPSS